MNIRHIRGSDSEFLAELSLRSFDRRDIMSKMGRSYLSEVFFPAVADDDSVFGRVADDNGSLLGYSLGFRNLHKFYARVRREKLFQNTSVTLQRLISFHLTPFDLLNLLASETKIFGRAPSPSHYGPIALAAQMKGTPTGGALILAISRVLLEDMASSGINNCWGIADQRNKPSWRLMELLGFERLFEIRLFGKTDYMYGRDLLKTS